MQPAVVTALIASVTSIFVAVTRAVLAYYAQHGLQKVKLDQGRRRSMVLGESLWQKGTGHDCRFLRYPTWRW